MLVGNLGMILCMWARVLINSWFYWIIIASIFGGVTSPFTGNIATKISASWFPCDQIVISNTISQLGSALGSALGAFFTLALVDTTDYNVSDAESMIFNALLLQAIVFSILFVISYFAYFDKPTLPPWYIYDNIN